MKVAYGGLRIRFNAAISLAFALCISGVAIANPGFDCTKASQQAERLICQSEKLSRQDVRLNRLYMSVMSKLTPDVQSEIRKEQLSWLKNRDQACNLHGKEAESCLLDAYRSRNSELSQLLAFHSGAPVNGDNHLRILRITPRGNDVPAGQQLVIQFDQPVVPIGRMERDAAEIPIEVIPELNCEWRWINTSALACQLRREDKMSEATHYRVQVNPGIKTEAGIGLRKSSVHLFTTARPKVAYFRFVNWLSPGTPLIQVTFNQPVTKQSVEQSLMMTTRQSSDKQTVDVMAYPGDMPRILPFWMKVADANEEEKVNDQLTLVKGDEARKVWVVEPVKELPGNETVWLDVKPGLVSSLGEEKGVESRQPV